MIKHIIYLVLILFTILNCKKDNKTSNKAGIEETVSSTKDSLISLLTLDDSFKTNDVRRYGVFPGKGIGTHPTTGNKKMDELLNLAENGVELTFPKGTYKTVLIISDRKNISLNFEEAAFTGAIQVVGTTENVVKDINLKGTLASYSSFFTRYADKIKIDSLILKNDKSINISNFNNTGCSIYTGTLSLYMDYLKIEGTGSDGDQYRYTPAALMIHGKSPAPNDILINKAEVESSDRHGAYLSGKYIEIKKLDILSYGKGKSDNMIPIAYTQAGDEKKITGVWLNDFEDSAILDLTINTSGTNITDALFLDSGDSTLASVISKLTIEGPNKKIRTAEATNVKYTQ